MKHGMHGTPEYSSWRSMVYRCTNERCKDYHRYGGAGVSIHPEWRKSFETFYAYMGPRPPGTTLDRIKGEVGYVPGNVRWATRTDQQRNRKTACVWYIKGASFESMQEAANHFAVRKQTIHKWVNGYFDARRNLSTPPHKDCYAIPRY